MSQIVKPHGDFVALTTAEAAKVNNQINTIYAELNGNLDDANVKALANINQSKIYNLVADLNAIRNQLGTAALIIDKNSTLVSVFGTLTNTQLYAKTLSGNILGNMGRLRFTAVGQVQILPLNSVVVFLNWGGIGSVLSHTIGGGTTTTRVTPWRWIIELFMNGASNSWRVYTTFSIANFEVSSGTDHVGIGVSNGPTSETNGNLNGSLDLASDRIFQISAQWNQANASNIFNYYHSFMELLP